MKIGMLWFDNNPKDDLITKVARASQYYQQKYGKTPNLCYVHPSAMTTNSRPESAKVVAAGVEVRASREVLPHHFWIGVHQ